MPKVLHITTHMGGGVGKFLSETIIYARTYISSIEHKIILLEQPEKYQFFETCKSNDIEVLVKDQNTDFYEEFKRADLVVLHWWHNPVMADFLRKFPQTKIRLILWVHISGCTYPSLPAELALLPHKTVFTTAFSYENPAWSPKVRKKVEENSTVIYGLGANSVTYNKVTARHHSANFRVGYVGTLSESKIHPEFVLFCKAVLSEIPSARFVLVGDLSGSAKIINDVRKYGFDDQFEFVGYTDRVDRQLESFDVFGYPLNPYHFGTTENVVIEAMSMGLPVVMLNQCTEKYIVTHNVDGLLANNAEEYGKYIKYLYDFPNERLRIGKNAKRTVLNKYSIKKNVAKMNDTFSEVLEMSACLFDFKSIFGDKPHEWFLSCLGKDKNLFYDSLDTSLMADAERRYAIVNLVQNCHPILRGKGKSSVLHFAEKYPDDENLLFWKQLIEPQ